MEELTDDLYNNVAASLFNAAQQYIDKQRKLGELDRVTILQIAELNSYGQRYIKMHAPEFISVTFDATKLSKRLKLWEIRQEEFDLENQFLLLQAPQKLMRQLFGMHTSTFTWRRTLLGLYNEGRHRPFECNAETELVIWKLWHSHQHLDGRTRYLTLYDITDYPISIIATAVKRYYEAEK